jgi:acetylornithine deacetylase
LSRAPETVDDAVEVARRDVLGIAERLIAFDTTVEERPGNPPRDERACQQYVAGLLSAAGFAVDLWEPQVDELRDHPSYVTGQNWHDRPNLVARLPGSGTGRSLLLNGHIDTVPAGETALWSSDPWRPAIRARRLYGRGACDMKGGLASMLAAALAIASSGSPPAGDLLVSVVTDEEVNGLGTVAMLRRGYRADAAIVPEPNNLEVHVAFRGILYGSLEVTGQSGHVEILQRHWSEGGGVNAVAKMRFLLDRLDRLSAEWRTRPDKQHPLCSTGEVQVTRIEGGDFLSSIPARCEATLNICYVPGEEDASGGGSRIRDEVESVIHRASQEDSWLAANPPGVHWSVDFPPAEIDPAAELPTEVARLLERRGLEERRIGLDTWDDTASLILAGVPAVSFGPGSNDQAHAVDEYIDIAELQLHAGLLVELIREWCGQQGEKSPRSPARQQTSDN